jgi:hypothetical protein
MFNTDPQQFLKNASSAQKNANNQEKLPSTEGGKPNKAQSKHPDTKKENTKLTSEGLNKNTSSGPGTMSDRSLDSKASVKSDGTQKQLELNQGTSDGTKTAKSTTSTKSFKEERQAKMGKHMNSKKKGAASNAPAPQRESGNIEDPGSPQRPNPNVPKHESIKAPLPPNTSIPSTNIPISKTPKLSIPNIKLPRFK